MTRFLFQRTAPTGLVPVERMIGRYKTADVESPPPPALWRWSSAGRRHGTKSHSRFQNCLPEITRVLRSPA